ncbi:MAG TPA: hypothetical protein VMH87_15210 [Pseudomonadales bacterium]|nr:hypothetical protein [Pseudomonadales bacterium]
MKTIMNIKILSLITTASIMGTASLLAITTSTPQTASVPSAPIGLFQTVGFSDSQEAAKLHQAYRILATGDHDYKGHRAKAMEQVKKAADMLGMDLRGDDKDKEKQVLSDDQLRLARGYLQNVLGASEVKDQKKISDHINAAIHQIDVALSVR